MDTFPQPPKLESFDTSKVKLTPLEKFINKECKALRLALGRIVRECKPDLKKNPDCYRMNNDEEPTVDVRLCIDEISTNSNPFSLMSPLEKDFVWLFRTGSVDYDQSRSKYCGASCVTRDCKIDDLLLELIEQVLEQEAIQ